MDLWKSLDVYSTLKSYEYTRYTKYQIYSTLESDDFKKMDSETIFHFISDKMEIVPFNDYLKRFIYQRTGMEEPFGSMGDKEYLNIMVNSFSENAAPYAFTPVKRKMRSVLRLILGKEGVKRSTIFLLGFGLNMSDSEVEEFLTKVNKEESFDFSNPEETVFWFCFHNHYRYSKAKELLDYYEALDTESETNESLWKAMRHDPKMYVHNEKELRIYLKYLKSFLDTEDPSYEVFMNLYDRVRELIASIYKDSAFIDNKEETYSKEDISPYIIESVFYTEIPREEKGNLEKMSASLLSKQFQNKRMGRQHISNILSRKSRPDRFDLITMLFFIYASDISYGVAEEDRTDRFRDYVDEINDILQQCNMAGIYPVNPYEAFILMCLVTEDPLNAYYDVWRLSYGGEL